MMDRISVVISMCPGADVESASVTDIGNIFNTVFGPSNRTVIHTNHSSDVSKRCDMNQDAGAVVIQSKTIHTNLQKSFEGEI